MASDSSKVQYGGTSCTSSYKTGSTVSQPLNLLNFSLFKNLGKITVPLHTRALLIFIFTFLYFKTRPPPAYRKCPSSRRTPSLLSASEAPTHRLWTTTNTKMMPFRTKTKTKNWTGTTQQISSCDTISVRVLFDLNPLTLEIDLAIVRSLRRVRGPWQPDFLSLTTWRKLITVSYGHG